MVTRVRSLAALVALAFLAAGCGDEALWARWRAESALYHARRLEKRLVTSVRHPSASAYTRVEARFEDVVDRFPASVWAAPSRAGGPARDVLLASGRAALEVGLLRRDSGREMEAAAALGLVERDYAALPGLVIRARAERVEALERAGRFDEELATRFALSGMDPVADPDAAEPSPIVLAAPLDLARRLRAAGRGDEAQQALADADARFTRTMDAAVGSRRVKLAIGVSLVRAARGDAPGALAAVREAMRADTPVLQPTYARLLAARALEAGAPESVFAYARWAASLNGSRAVAGQAWLVAGQAWELLGVPDSALASYDAVLTQWIDPGTIAPEARWRQAQLLERIGQWERARSGYVAMAARFPTHPRSFLALRQVVIHHLEAGEPEIARVSGESALQNLQRLLETNEDPVVQREGRAVVADLQIALGRLDQGEATLLDLWRRFPEDSLAEDAGLRAARLAEHRPGGAAQAESIRVALRTRAVNAAVRREAEAGS